MPSFSAAATANGASWCVVVTIEGCGTDAGLFHFCSRVPGFASSDANWRPWIKEGKWPDLMSETVEPAGGMPQPGNLALELVDIGNALTSEWRTQRGPITFLDGSLSKTATSADLIDASGVVPGDVLWLSNEALIVGGVSTDTITGLTRGALDTDAISHNSLEEVYGSIPFLQGRRIRMFLIPQDAASASDLTAFGVYRIDSLALAGDMNSYIIQGQTSLKYLDRTINGGTSLRKPGPMQIRALESTGSAPVVRLDHSAPFDPWTDGTTASAYFKCGAEAVEAEVSATGSSAITIKNRGQLGTRAGSAALAVGDDAYLVIAADTSDPGPGGFRFIPGSSWSQLSTADQLAIDRESHLWQRSSHWVDILLCLLTSSLSGDEAELQNGDADFGNWGSLPAAYGLGIPANLIDFRSFVEIKERTPDFLFPNFHIGEGSPSFKRLITDTFLSPIGAYITTESGAITLRMPRIPMKDAGLTAWTSDTINLDQSAAGSGTPSLTLAQDVSKIATSVEFITRTPSGGKASAVFNDSSFEGWSVAKPYYAQGAQPLVFDVPAISSESAAGFLRRLGMRKLFRFRRPLWSVGAETGLSEYAKVPGDLVALTLDELPNNDTGTRGWVSVACEIVGRELSVNEDLVGLRFDLLAFSESRVGRVSASGYVVGVAGPSSGDYTLDLADNLYTDADALNDLPALDASSFRADDVVTLIDVDGSDAASGTTQIVQSVTGSSVVIDGNFGGSLAAGTTIVFADRAAAISDQYDFFVFFASRDDTPPNIGSSGDAPWRYGE